MVDDDGVAALADFMADCSPDLEFATRLETEPDVVAHTARNPAIRGDAGDRSEAHARCSHTMSRIVGIALMLRTVEMSSLKSSVMVCALCALLILPRPGVPDDLHPGSLDGVLQKGALLAHSGFELPASAPREALRPKTSPAMATTISRIGHSDVTAWSATIRRGSVRHD